MDGYKHILSDKSFVYMIKNQNKKTSLNIQQVVHYQPLVTGIGTIRTCITMCVYNIYIYFCMNCSLHHKWTSRSGGLYQLYPKKMITTILDMSSMKWSSCSIRIWIRQHGCLAMRYPLVNIQTQYKPFGKWSPLLMDFYIHLKLPAGNPKIISSISSLRSNKLYIKKKKQSKNVKKTEWLK